MKLEAKFWAVAAYIQTPTVVLDPVRTASLYDKSTMGILENTAFPERWHCHVETCRIKVTVISCTKCN